MSVRFLRNAVPLAAGAVLALGLAGCGDDEPAAAKKGLAGDWQVVDATGPAASTNKGVKYAFDGEGNVTLGGFNKCTYTHTAPDLAIKCGTVTITWKAELKDADQTLVLTNDSAKQVLTLKRG